MRLPEDKRSGLGQEIKKLRRLRRLTQEQLEEKSRVGQSTISAIENGRQDQTSIEYLRRLATALEVSVNVLLAAAGLMDEDNEEMEFQRSPLLQLPLSDPDESFDPDAIVAYVESRPGIHFQDRLRQQRERLSRPDYVRFCVGLFRAWSSNSDLALTSVELSAER